MEFTQHTLDERNWINIYFPLNLHQGDMCCIKTAWIVSHSFLRTSNPLRFISSVVYKINSQLIFSDQVVHIDIPDLKPLLHFTSSFDGNAKTLSSLFETIWYLLTKNRQVHPMGDIPLPEIYTSTQNTKNLNGLKRNHEKSM